MSDTLSTDLFDKEALEKEEDTKETERIVTGKLVLYFSNLF